MKYGGSSYSWKTFTNGKAMVKPQLREIDINISRSSSSTALFSASFSLYSGVNALVSENRAIWTVS